MSEAAITDRDSPAPVAATTSKGKGKGKARAKAEGEKDGKWPTEDTAKLLLIMLQQDNPELLATGWQKIFEKVHGVFGDKYTDAAVK